jgi:putative flippase GtrA
MLLYTAVEMNLREMFVAGLGGAAGTVVDMSTLVLLVGHRVPVAPSAFVAASGGAVVCFLMNKFIAFNDGTPVSKQQVTRFGLVAVATAMLMALMMQLTVVGLGMHVVLAKIMCSALVFLAWTYPAQRRLVFRRSLA